MERISPRENFLLGYAAQRAFEGPSSVPKSPFRSSDVDFNDVFGGPPRRFSLHETRYSSDGAMESEETVLFRSLSGEKPVFGEETSVNRRKNRQSNDFFDDIFRGDKSCSSPRRDFMNSLPGSRVMSPSRPLPPKSEPFGTSLPVQFSLPATLTKAMDYATFATSSSFKKKEGTASGISTPSSSLSRFSSQTMQVQDDFSSDVWPSNGPSPLSNEFSLRNEELSYVAKSNETNMRRDLRDNSKNTEAPTDINEFHFSIYKWASSGVPIMMPLRKGISSKSKEKDKLARCSSSKGSIQSDTVCELLPANACSTDTHSISVKSEFSKMECEKLANTITLKGTETCLKEVIVKPESDILETTQVTVEKSPDCTMWSNKSEETKPNSLPEISFSDRTDKVFTVTEEEAHKPMLKPLRSILRDEIDGQENEDIVMKVEGKENVAKTTKLSHSNVDASKDVKKHNGKIINSNRTEVNKASSQGSPKSPGGNIKRSGVRGKVKDFVKIFNQETSSKTKSIADSQNQSCSWEGKVSGAKVNEASISTNEMETEVHLPNVNKIPDVLEDENVEKPKKHHAHIKSTIHTSIDNSSDPKEASPFSFQSQMKSTINTSNDNSSDQKEVSPFSEPIPDDSKVTRESIDDPFQVNYLIQELPNDQIKISQTSEDHEAIKALDAKILKWSSGKKGNIRSLLSTLQYVLWEESGWKPVALVNIIEGNAVKRAYQKALLCLHPDKLQQKGAASHQKYTAEKVFDILQEAWDHFNSLGSI